MTEYRSRGFTLLELIIFIALAGLLIPALVLAFRQGIVGINIPTQVAGAGFAAQEKLEWFMQFDYGDPQVDPGQGSDEVTVNGKVYSRKWKINFYNIGSPSPQIDTGYKQIDIYSTTAELPHPVELHTLITKR
jgi:type II secretory pathway pseudopilin PulG